MKRLPILFVLLAVLMTPRGTRAQVPLGAVAATFPYNVTKLLADPTRDRVYAAVSSSNSIVVFDTTTLTVLATVPIGSNPSDMAISPDGNTLYVANSGSTLAAIGILDLNTLTTRTSLPLPGAPLAIAAGLGQRLYMTASGSFEDTVYQIDGTTGTVQTTFGTDIYTDNALQIAPDGKTLFVSSLHLDPDTLQSYDVSTATPVLLQTNSDTGENGAQLIVSHNGKYLCLPSGGGNGGGYATFLFAASDIGSHYGSFNNGSYPGVLAFSPDDSLVYQSVGDSPTLQIFNTTSFAQVGQATSPTIGQNSDLDEFPALVTERTGSYLFVSVSDTYDTGSPSELVVLTTGAGTLTPPSVQPIITGALSIAVPANTPFAYQITASGSPTLYGATGLPTGLSINTATGLISGTFTGGESGYGQATITASNASGTSTATLQLLLDETFLGPVITTTSLPNGVVGQAYRAALTATNSPASYSANNLPVGLSIDSGTGVISGAPTLFGPSFVTITVEDANYNSTTAAFALNILPVATAAPVITSASSASGTIYSAFAYQITATKSPTNFSATGLPAGLSIDPGTGAITGVPTAAGTFPVSLSVSNALGVGTATLTLNIMGLPVPAPVITSSPTAQGMVGVAFTYQIVASNSPTTFTADGLPPGLGVNAGTGLISGVPTTPGTSTVTLNAANAGGTGTATLTLTVSAGLPTIDIVATVSRVTAGSGDHAVVTINRTGDLTQKLYVLYSIKGSAKNGTDYVKLTGKAKIKPNKASANIQIIPIGDGAGSGTKVIKLVVIPEAAYQVGTAAKAKVKIVPGG